MDERVKFIKCFANYECDKPNTQVHIDHIENGVDLVPRDRGREVLYPSKGLLPRGVKQGCFDFFKAFVYIDIEFEKWSIMYIATCRVPRKGLIVHKFCPFNIVSVEN